jgi:hypothetical protein
VKGSITFKNEDKQGKWKLVVTAPDGKKYEIRVSENGSFEAKLPFQNRSFSSKAVHFELYYDNALVVKTDITHNTPVNQTPKKSAEPVKVVKFEKDDEHENNNGERENNDGEHGKSKEKQKKYGKHFAKRGEKHKNKDHEHDHED